MYRLSGLRVLLQYAGMKHQDTKESPDQDGSGTEAPPVSEMVLPFLDHLRIEEGRVPVTIVRYRARLERFIQAVGDCPVSDITPELVALYKRKLLDSSLGPATMAGLLSCLRSFLRYLHDVRHLQVLEPEKVKRVRIPNRTVDYLTKDEVERLMRAIPTHTWSGRRDKALIEALFCTGMRISEALSLNRDQIDWERNQARIVGKGNKERLVYFNERTREALLSYLSYRHDDEKALFITNGDEPQRLKPHGSWRRFHRYARLAGIGKRVYPHMLRHTMATTLLENGCPIGHIRVLLGHAHLATTCKYYLGMMSDAEAKAAHAKFLHLRSELNEESTAEPEAPFSDGSKPTE
jgi:integrase/recombinase XerD